MKKITVFSVLMIIMLLITQLSSFVVAAPPEDNPGNGPPTLEKMVFVHYRSDFAPGKPVGTPVKPGKTPQLYVYDKIHWPLSDAAAGIIWYYNTANSPLGTNSGAIKYSFAAWDSVGNATIDFNYQGAIGLAPGFRDYHNVVGWDYISDQYQGAIGVTVVWYYRSIREKIIVECDTTLNTDSEFNWSWDKSTGDLDGKFIVPLTVSYDVDVQDIMTHEAGHWLMLGDMYTDASIDQTMHGYAYDGELNKRSLESGDIAGINAIY